MRKIEVVVDTTCLLVVDLLTILPSSVKVYDGVQNLNLPIIIENDRIKMADEFCQKYQGKKIQITYRVFSINFNTVYTGLDTTLHHKGDIRIKGAYGSPGNVLPNNIIDSDGLQYRGSFGRGLSVGNNQSFVLNSNFDLQLNGDIGNGIKVIAAISDENLPIQAQGNTQQLQEFDRVFIQLSKGKTSLIAGDYEMRNQSGYFMQYYKKLKGISMNTSFDVSKKIKSRQRAGFAISRGKFARQIINNQEGNQGPYKLNGNNNERFIIVLSGTEKVYFNGILLKRGFDLDYVIDYNRAEVTFSPTRVVARDSRIIIEFEYTDVNYVRTLYEYSAGLQASNWDWYLNAYSEQDSKSQTGNSFLDSTDIRILEESGDDLSKMVRNSIRIADTTHSDINSILYKLVENPLDPGVQILVFTNNLDSAKYTAIFTEVGIGKGDYDIDNNTNINGRVYKFVGKNMGKYAPLVQLIPPEQKQLFTTGGYYQLTKKLKFFGEGGLSRFDVNTRSAIGNENNSGVAGNLGILYQTSLDSAGDWRLASQHVFEHVQAAFQPLNPFRNAEFSRDWNIPIIPDKTDENLLSSSLVLTSKKGFSFDYGLKYFERKNQYKGLKHTGRLLWNYSFFDVAGVVSYLSSNNHLLQQRTSFLRPNVKLSIFLDPKKNWAISSEMDAEQNIIRNSLTSGIVNGSASYQHYKIAIGNNPEKKVAIKAGINRRYDQLPGMDTLRQTAVADELELVGKWTSDDGNSINIHVTNRNLQILIPELLPTAKSTKSLIGKMDIQWAFFKKSIKTNWLYAVSSGQEPKIEYKFVKLETGRGDFVYIGQDEKPNLSILQDFRFNPSDPLANYIRISLYNNEFIRTNNIEINQSIRADLNKIFIVKSEFSKSKKRWFRSLSRFSVLSNARIQKRVNEGGVGSTLAYVNFSRVDTGLVAYTSLLNNTLFFNRGNIHFDLQLGNRLNDSRIVQVNGFEDRIKKDLFLKSRIRIIENLDIILNAEKGESHYVSKIFTTRNFNINFFDVYPEINFRPNEHSRWVMLYKYSLKQQTILGMEKAEQHKMTMEYNWRKAATFNIDFQMNYIIIQFDGMANSSIEYDMLEGLKNGNNFVWNVGFTRRLASSIDLIIQYEGRKPGINPVIHVGQAQVKATF
ncbi:MAG: hypothetical protein WAT79_09800 [Saprospiraceae bacterium]